MVKENRTALVSLVAGKVKRSKDSKVALFCKGSKRSGLGHIYRSLYIAKDLWREGIRTIFNKDGEGVSVVVVDLPEREEALNLFNYFKGRAFLVLFDNDGGLGCLEADLLVYPDFIPIDRSKVKAKSVLTGWDYVYPPYEIRALKGLPPEGEDILVTFGGSDPKGLTAKFLSLLIGKASGLKRNIHVLFGPLNTEYLPFLKEGLPSNVRLYRSLRDPSFLYRRSTLIVSSGGLSFAYAVFLGRLTIGVPQNDMEERRIKFYSDRFSFVRFAPSIKDALRKLLSALESGEA